MPKILLAACTALVAFEVGLRVFDWYVPMANIWRWHPVFGWTQDPNAEFDYTFDGEPVHADFNTLGFRDVEHRIAKPRGTRRIAVLGDSFCESIQVNFEETFYRLLARNLSERTAGPVEVLNFGVGDWGQAQQLLVLRELGLSFDPDLVVCQVVPLNDICNNAIELYGLGHSHNDFYRPYFVQRDGELMQTWRHPWRQRLRQWSRIYLNIERVVERWRWSAEPGSDADRWRARAEAAGFTSVSPLESTFLPEDRQPAAVRAGWRITERLLEEMATTCRAHGIEFVVLVIAWEERIGKAAERFRKRVHGLTLIDYPERRFTRWSERTGIPVVLTRTLFEREIETFLPCRDGHLGPGGHRLVAEALQQAIEAHGWLR